MHAALQRVIEDVIAPAAAEVDRNGTFPRRQVAALQREGILGLTVPTTYGGGGKGLAEAEEVVREIGAVCGSTAMVVTMHFSAAAALSLPTAQSVLPRSPRGATSPHSRSPRPVRVATSGRRSARPRADGENVRLDARKSWVTSAGEADSYVWSSLPLAADGPMTLWYVPSGSAGLAVTGPSTDWAAGQASRPVDAET